MIRFFSRFTTSFKNRTRKTYTVVKRDIQKRPLINFYLALAVLVLLVIASNIIRTKPPVEQKESTEPKPVQVYHIGSVPKMTVQAQIEKTGVVQIVALSGGVVQTVHFHEGDEVAKGNTLVSMSSNYQGGNTFSIQRQLAQNQYQAAQDTYNLQIDVINQQRNIATMSAQNAEDMRKITDQSLGDTRSLISLNETMLRSVDETLTQLEQSPDADQTMLQSLRGQKAQLLSATAQARSGLRTAEYQAAADKPPAQMAAIQKDIALKQLELQEKTLNVSKEAARLQLQLAYVTEGLMFPSAPLSGTVQRVFVKEGDVVAPGTPLLVIAQPSDGDPITAVAYVPRDIAQNVSRVETSVLKIDGATYEEYPYFISTEAVQGNSYAVYYAVPESFSADLTQKGFIEIEMPIGYADTSAAVMYIPIDAVYQTTDSAYLFTLENNTSVSKTVTLGSVYGTYVEVTKGLTSGDQVIITRNVLNGDKVVIQN